MFACDVDKMVYTFTFTHCVSDEWACISITTKMTLGYWLPVEWPNIAVLVSTTAVVVDAFIIAL